MTDQAVPVRPIGLDDAPLLARLHAPCFPDEPWPAGAFATLLESTGTFGLLAYAGTVPLDHALATALKAPPDQTRGFILCRRVLDEAEVLTLAVAPDVRRAGYGRRLLVGALGWAAHHGVTTVYLEVAEDNTAARTLYTAGGFTRVGQRPRYYPRAGQQPVAALVLARTVTEFCLPLQSFATVSR